MIDPNTHRFYIEHDPRCNRRIHIRCPIRDIGTAADVAELRAFFPCSDVGSGSSSVISTDQGERLDVAVLTTLQNYVSALHRERSFNEERGAVTAQGLGGTETEIELGDKPLPWWGLVFCFVLFFYLSGGAAWFSFVAAHLLPFSSSFLDFFPFKLFNLSLKWGRLSET
jgi:hypothetical protein